MRFLVIFKKERTNILSTEKVETFLKFYYLDVGFKFLIKL